MIEKVCWFIFRVTEISIFGYFFYVSFYNLTLSIFGFIKPNISFSKDGGINKIVVLIPAYKEDTVILQTVKELLKVNYPPDAFLIVVIADSFFKKTLSVLRSLPVKLIEVSFELSTKVKAINSCLEQLAFHAEIMVVLDADNKIERDFLNKVNSLINQNYMAVQGRRLVKNPVNHMTFLDDLSEQINNHINRKGACAIGGSSSIAGSGFAVSYNIGKKIFNSLESVGGFDKEFELLLLKYGIKTKYVEDLWIFDEKVANKDVFKNQRRRWISSQYVVLRKYFKAGILSLFKGDFSFFNSCILRNIQLPRLLNLGIFSIIFLFASLYADYLRIPFTLWCIIYSMFLTSILIAIPKRFYGGQLLQSILMLPGIFLQMLVIMFKLRGVNKNFVHTPHGTIISKDDN